MTAIMPGMYVAAESPVHRLDPRVKMGAALALMALPFAVTSVASSLMLSAFIVVVVLLSRIPLLALLRALQVVVWTGLLIFVFYAFGTPGRALFILGPISATWEGVVAGGMQAYRLFFLVLVSSFFTYTTSPSQLAHGVEAVLKPLIGLGLPVGELTVVLSIALRLVPTLFEEIDNIVKAQEARGASIRTGPLPARARGWVSIFVPVFVSAFRRAEQLATAMEARGFRSANERTHLYELRLTRRDVAATLVMLAFAAAVLIAESQGC